ncbi:MAG: hypothetical protein GOVbin140_72 [Prokaryotic dsDNA virus sp.]|nr:MAG: hypothetical protein GOVbin140_72 [Prokaryotic dsDNA virus sp.]|tara:strand:- start:32948 stop:33667 length:720 start_codon:yes stop_codon:yes gene_type:complete
MGLLGTSNKNLSQQITAQGQSDFKVMNNLLTLQENHVEEFFTYHGEMFLTAFEQLLEDVVERVVSRQLIQLKFNSNPTGDLEVHPDSIREFEQITAANIQLDLQNLLASALNTEVIMQRKMAKQQYLESQGFQTNQVGAQQPQLPQGQMPQGQVNAGGLNPSQISGGNPIVQANNVMMQQQQAFNNPSGYPVAPNGYDTMGNPYWIDPNTGQPSYTPPGSGLGISNLIQKGAAWAAWLA